MTLALLLMLDIADPSSVSAENTNNPASDVLNYREILSCGPNSLFMFLILSGRTGVALDELKFVPITSEGTSLLALRDAAKRFGIDTEICRYRREEVDDIPLPAIGQFYTSTASPTRLHFDVIYKIDSAFFYLLNGTTGETNRMGRSRLPIYWTGYVLVEKEKPFAFLISETSLTSIATCLAVGDVMVLLLWFHKFQIVQKKQHLKAAEALI